MCVIFLLDVNNMICCFVVTVILLCLFGVLCAVQGEVISSIVVVVDVVDVDVVDVVVWCCDVADVAFVVVDVVDVL